jgi:DNA-binding response OmpR family regulator
MALRWSADYTRRVESPLYPMHPTILLVEKDTVTRELYQRELATQFTVISCADVVMAREAIARNRVDVLIIEPAGLGTEGWGMLQEFKQDPCYANLPIIVCSTLDAYDASLKSLFIACLVKPVLPANLILAVQEILQKHHRSNPLPGGGF